MEQRSFFHPMNPDPLIQFLFTEFYKWLDSNEHMLIKKVGEKSPFKFRLKFTNSKYQLKVHLNAFCAGEKTYCEKCKIEHFPVMVEIQEVENLTSPLLRDYQAHDCKPPSLNKLLDWRSRLVEKKILNQEEKEYPDEWYEKEIKAVDYLLNKHYTE